MYIHVQMPCICVIEIVLISNLESVLGTHRSWSVFTSTLSSLWWLTSLTLTTSCWWEFSGLWRGLDPGQAQYLKMNVRIDSYYNPNWWQLFVLWNPYTHAVIIPRLSSIARANNASSNIMNVIDGLLEAYKNMLHLSGPPGAFPVTRPGVSSQRHQRAWTW